MKMFAVLALSAMVAGAQLKGTVRSGGPAMTQMHARGDFVVAVKPTEPSDIAKAADTGRMTIDKSWTGGIVGTSKGEMLTGLTSSTGSMAYVAMERMDVSVEGHQGTFLLRHTASMQKGETAGSVLDIAVVPNSGTGQLAGIAGALTIVIDQSGHHYDFSYTLPAKPVS